MRQRKKSTKKPVSNITFCTPYHQKKKHANSDKVNKPIYYQSSRLQKTNLKNRRKSYKEIGGIITKKHTIIKLKNLFCKYLSIADKFNTVGVNSTLVLITILSIGFDIWELFVLAKKYQKKQKNRNHLFNK